MAETHPIPSLICTHCGTVLTDEERRYYEHACEQCERDELDRWQAWRHGANDPELDALFTTPGLTLQ